MPNKTLILPELTVALNVYIDYDNVNIPNSQSFFEYFLYFLYTYFKRFLYYKFKKGTVATAHYSFCIM